MDSTRRAEIRDLAERIRVALDLDVPVDVDSAVARLGGKVETAPGPSPVEAQIRKSGGSFLIELSDDSDSVRKRFSLAHELGHLFLHMGYLIDDNRWNSIDEYVDSPMQRFGHSEEEFEAHEFAGAFLMPELEFRNIAASHLSGDSYQILPIARHFNVSVLAARTRGRWLGLFAWD